MWFYRSFNTSVNITWVNRVKFFKVIQRIIKKKYDRKAPR